MRHVLSAALLIAFAACGSVSRQDDMVGDDSSGGVPVVTASTDQVDTIHVTWTAVDGATRYVVLSSEAQAGPFTQVSEATTTAGYDVTGLGRSDAKYFKVQ